MARICDACGEKIPLFKGEKIRGSLFCDNCKNEYRNKWTSDEVMYALTDIIPRIGKEKYDQNKTEYNIEKYKETIDKYFLLNDEEKEIILNVIVEQTLDSNLYRSITHITDEMYAIPKYVYEDIILHAQDLVNKGCNDAKEVINIYLYRCEELIKKEVWEKAIKYSSALAQIGNSKGVELHNIVDRQIKIKEAQLAIYEYENSKRNSSFDADDYVKTNLSSFYTSSGIRKIENDTNLTEAQKEEAKRVYRTNAD